MSKKDFWLGFVLAIALMVGGTFVWKTAVIKQWIFWDVLPFDMEMERTTKMEMITEFLERYYVEDLDIRQMNEYVYYGLVSGVGDPYTYYLTAEELDQYLENSGGHFEGIGVEVFVTTNGDIVVYSVMEGQPAEGVGVKSLDVIVEVNGQSTSGMPLNDVVGMMRGLAGTSVDIVVYRESVDERIPFTIVRGEVVVKSVKSEILDNNIGYIELSGFKENSYEQFKTALEEMKVEGIEGLILDLRGNPGGLVNAVYRIGEELLPQGTMVYTEDKYGNREDLVCDDIYYDIPLVVLVNGNSASASEILAGAVKDMGAGTVVGTQTFGKGLVQRLFFLPDGSGLNITIEKYYTPNEISIHGVGVTPDYVVELPSGYSDGDNIPLDEDTQLQKGVEILKEKIGIS